LGYRGVSLPEGPGAERLWHDLFAGAFIRRQGYTAVLFPGGSRFLPPASRVPSVAMVIDPPAFGDAQALRRLDRAERIIVPSEFVKTALGETGETVGDSRVTVIHQGIDPHLFFPRPHSPVPSEEDMADIQPFAIQRPYLMYPSTIRGGDKKHEALVDAFSRFKEKTGAPHRLVLAGSFAAGLAPLTAKVAASPVASDIVMTGYFPHHNLPLLYAYADACVFPGTREGVGLPVIEAMASGLPVACSRSGALPEIAGDHALFFDSNDIDDMADALETILFDQALRKKLTASALEWVKQYRWTTTAAETFAILRFFC
jgi:glycosyltransferase involved in cell wall biosynthesis